MAVVVNIFLLVKSHYKVVEIKTPLENITWNQSYCVTTLYLVRIIQALLCLNICALINRIYAFGLYQQTYQSYAYRGDQQHYCKTAGAIIQSGQTFGLTLFFQNSGYGNIITLMSDSINRTLLFLIFLIQLLEWCIAIHLINYQKSKTVDEILVDNYGEFTSKEALRFQNHETRIKN